MTSAAQFALDDAPEGPLAQPQELLVDGRIVNPRAVTPASNADETATTENGAEDTNTNPDRVVTLDQSQSTWYDAGSDSPGPIQEPPTGGASGADLDMFYGGDVGAPVSAGAGAPRDDSATAPGVTAENITITSNTQLIKPQPNVLDNFYSHTYSVSVYLLSPSELRKILASNKKAVSGYQLLFQTGGAPINTGGARGVQADPGTGQLFDTAQQAAAATANSDGQGRNPFFQYDYYIDSVTIENALPGKQTRMAHLVTDLKFTVVEPNGITLLDNLYKAVQDHVPKDGADAVNYVAVTYLMVIKFFGYDQNGNIQKVGRVRDDGTIDPNAVVEKYIPFHIREIKWGVSNKLVTYEFSCAPVGQSVAATTRRGTVPYDVELSAASVGELLGDNTVYTSPTLNTGSPVSTSATTDTTANSTIQERGGSYADYDIPVNDVPNTPPPPKATSAPDARKIVKKGLMGAMNDFQQDLVQRKIYQRADKYFLEFTPEAAKLIKDAKVVLPETKVNKSATPVNQPATKNASSLNLDAIKADNDVRNFTITAGQQILQAIDLAIRNSEFIYRQGLIQFTEENQAQYVQQPPEKQFNWYQVSMRAEPTKYDALRNDYAYNIYFTISVVPLSDFNSKFFPVPKFRGIHKSYPYWFTGQNTAVLDFQQTFNTLYQITVSGKYGTDSAAERLRRKYTSSMREMPFYTYDARSGESGSGAELKGNELGANAADYIYSPSDLANVKLKILGDPAWIQQGSVSGTLSPTTFTPSAFNPDGTINFDANQVMFEVVWQRPEDYNPGTGLADPYSGGYSGKPNKSRTGIQSNVYRANKVVSEFKQGKFEQTIEGSLYFFPKPDGQNAASNDKKAVSTQANVRSVDNAIESAAQQNTASQSVVRSVDNAIDAQARLQSAGAENQGGAVASPGSSSETSAESSDTGTPGPFTATPAPPPEPATSNGEDVMYDNYDAPLKIGQNDDAVVDTPPLGDYET